MAISVVQICNLALANIGIYNRITSIINPTSKEARECKLRYDLARDFVLESHDWSFARKRRTLNKDENTYSGWTYAYQVPSDCIMPRRIYDPLAGQYNKAGMDINAKLIKFEHITNSDLNRSLILTNQDDADLIYTARVEDPNRFSPSFISALSHYLAGEMALNLRGKAEYQSRELQIFTAMIAQAKVIDTQRGEEDPQTYNSLMGARY